MIIEITTEEIKELENASILTAKLLGRIYHAKEFEFQESVLKMPTFGERLRALREHNCLTKTELARRCRISVKSINRYESGKNEPRYIHTLCAFAYWLNCKVDLLLGRDMEGLKR